MALRTKPKRPTCATSSPFSKPSDQLSTLFRSVSMPLALALAMTEQSEKAIRQEIMQKNDCNEIDLYVLQIVA
jgi:hypothetical protein